MLRRRPAPCSRAETTCIVADTRPETMAGQRGGGKQTRAGKLPAAETRPIAKPPRPRLIEPIQALPSAGKKTNDELIRFAAGRLQSSARAFAEAGWALAQLKRQTPPGEYLATVQQLGISRQTAAYAINVWQLLAGQKMSKCRFNRHLESLTISQITEISRLGPSRVKQLLKNRQLDLGLVAKMPHARLREHVRDLRAIADGRPPPSHDRPSRARLPDPERALKIAEALRGLARELAGLLQDIPHAERGAIATGCREGLTAAQAALAEAGIGE